MSHMKRLIVILFLLMFTTALTCSQTTISLDGPGGLSILNSLTKSSQNQTNDSLNQTNDSLNATNHTANLNRTSGTSSSDFWSWGTRPKNHTANYNPSVVNHSAVNSPPDPLAMSSDLADINSLAEQNAFATA